jgi:hypothetical protein
MLVIVILLFAGAALGGLYLLSYILKNKNTPKGIAIIHGGVAFIALTLLIIYGFFNHPTPILSILLFIAAAAGGFILFYRDIGGKLIPKWLALGHGTIAIIAFIFLVAFAFY